MAMRLEPTPALLEDKYCLLKYYEFADTTEGSMYWLSLIEKGTERGQRIGRIINYNYLDLWAYCTTQEDLNFHDTPWLNRIVILYDRQSNKTTIGPDDFLDTAITPIRDRCMAPFRADNRYRWILLADHKFFLQNRPAGGTASDMYHVVLDISNLAAYYNDEAGYQTSCISGGLWAYFQSYVGASVTWSFTSELHFTDP